MDLESYLKNNLILIISNNIKNKIIKYINSLNQMYNIKIMTFNDIKKHLLFDYNEQTIYYLINQKNISFSNALELINNMYYLFEDNYENNKLNNLNNLKKELINNNLLIKDNYFIESLKNKQILVLQLVLILIS